MRGSLSVVAPATAGLALLCTALLGAQHFRDAPSAPPPVTTEPNSITALGNYPNTSVQLSGNTTVTPDATPANTTSITVSTDTNFKGTFAASPTTGAVEITDAHPAGTYTVTVIAFGPVGRTTKTFTLTVNGGLPCPAQFTSDFINAPDVSVGFHPNGVAVGDFNGDGKQDLAVVNAGVCCGPTSTVSIRLGDGLGGFNGSTEVGVGSFPYSVAIGDFNGDGKQDLAVTNYSSNSVSIRLGDGLGGFSGSTEISVGAGPYIVVIGDFNGDGKQDLAVLNENSGTVSIRLGDGLGGFSGSTEVSGGSYSLAIGDFNGDGKQDLAIVRNSSSKVSIRLGDGLGGFGGSTDVSVGSFPYGVAIGDFNGDGKQDLAVTNSGNRVSIRLGDGLGGFSGSTEVNVGAFPLWVATGDFNRDGKQDLAVANQDSSTVSIRLGDGLGGFTGSTEVSAGAASVFVAIGDFNGDGKQDLATANFNSGPSTASIRLGECIPVPTPSPTPTPVIVTVTTTSDSGPGSLRQTLADANDQTTIQFDPALNGQTISLTSGELLIGANITISGPGPGLLTISRNQQAANFRIFHITSGHSVAISGLTISNGRLTNENGAGILNSGTLTITNCVVTANSASSPGTMPSVGGGGIYNDGTLTLLNTAVTSNSTSFGTVGGAGIFNTATLTITQSAINSNSCYIAGGGILNSGMLTISNSTINNNQAAPLGHSSGNGGGINNSGTAIIQNSTVSGNSVSGDGTGGQGGGIANYASLEITSSTVSGNTAIYGAGIYFYGGGRVTNSTVSGNTAQFNGGGIWGGSIISNSTISGNSASNGGGIYATRAALELSNSVLKAGGSGANISNNGTTVTSHGYNISSDNGGGFLNGPGDQINTNPLLSPLQNNGGPTLTHALLSGSQAIDTGDPNFTPPPSTDQRGLPRVYNGRIDKGSFELQAATPCPVVLYDQTDNAGNGGVVSQNFEPANNIYDAQAADDFVVPAMQNWTVQKVKVNGTYFNGPGPAASANVMFYYDAGGFPRSFVPLGNFDSLPIVDTAGSFTIPLPRDLVLTAGAYWVSVQANMDFNSFGEWAWNDRTVASNSAAAWQNPGGGFTNSCLTYGRRGANCGIDPTAPDQVFQILGCPVSAIPVTISGTISYCTNPVHSPVSNANLFLSGSAAGFGSSDASGNYMFSVPSGGSYTVTPTKTPLTPASSSAINTVDAVAVQRHFLHIGTPLSGCPLTAANVNLDGMVNTVDVVAIQRFFLAFTSGTANVGVYQFTPDLRIYPTVVTNQPNQNYDALVLGDVVTPYIH